MSKPIITELNVTELEKLQATMGNSILIIKFGAEWCGPCKKIAPTYKKFISKSANNIICADIDVDDSIDLYIS
jgi:thioredoxin 1